MLKILVVDDEKQARDNMIHCINVVDYHTEMPSTQNMPK